MDIVTLAAARKAARTFSADDAGKAMVVGADGVIVAETIAAGEVVIDDTLAIQGAAADAKATGETVNALHLGLAPLMLNNLLDGTTWTSGKYINYDSGNTVNSDSANASAYIDVTGISKIVYTRVYSTSSSIKWGIAFYDESKTYISGQRCARSQPESTYKLYVADVPAGAKYVRITVGNQSITNFKPGAIVADAGDLDAMAPTRMNAAASDISALKANLGTAHTTAQSNIADGEYFCYNGTTLCQATAAIASGETITIGTNCQVVTLDAVLNALAAAIAAIE